MLKRFTIALICIAVLAMSFSLLQNWNIGGDNHITFKIKSALGMVDGTLGGLKGSIAFDPNDLASSKLDVTLDLATIATGMNKRDKDIKDEKVWFDIAQYPLVTFKSNKISKTTAGYVADGSLTIKATTKNVSIPFTFSEVAGVNAFVGTFKINRLDYGVGASTVMVKDTVDIKITVPVKR